MLLSKVIRFFTKAKYSHCWFSFEHNGKTYLWQADMGGVQIDPADKFFPEWINITWVPLKQPVSLEPAWDYLADNYGYAVLFGDLWVILGRWFKQKWRNPFHSAHALVCSQFVLDVLRDPRNSYPGLQDLDESGVQPADLYDALTKP